MRRKLVITAWLCFLTLQVFAQSPSPPAARSGYSLAYDANRGAVVLFGGQDTSSRQLGDTWEWSAGSWKRVNVAGPSARMNAAMAYNADKKLVFLFGGRSVSGPENDLWAYDGSSWSKINTARQPPSRQLGTMAFDKGQSQLALFGGMDANKKAIGDTWILNNDKWIAITTKGPAPRASHCMAYNDALKAVVIYGGYIDGAASKEFWELKDGAWQQIDGSNGPARIHAAMAYDSDKRRMLMFGGFNETVRTNELWEYANNKWSMIALGNDKIPDPRAEHRCVYIPGQGLFVFGGVTGPDPNTRNRGNDTWLYNGTSWSKLN